MLFSVVQLSDHETKQLSWRVAVGPAPAQLLEPGAPVAGLEPEVKERGKVGKVQASASFCSAVN